MLRINGTLNINNAFSFPTADGVNGQVLTTDGNGILSWLTLTNAGFQDLSLSNNTLSLTNDNTTVDLSTYQQNIDLLQLNGNNLEISLSNDGQATQSVDLSSINATKTLIADADNDTKIQVEESADEDAIRFDLGGSERLAITKNANGNTLISLLSNSNNSIHWS